MRSALLLLILLAAGVAAAFWLADLGGVVEIRVGETWIGLSFPIAVLLLAAAFILLHAILSAIGALRRWPERVRSRRAARRRAEGDAAVTRALVALAAGTGDAARLEVRKARGALGDTPQTLLLAAEAERLAGREAAAEETFRVLAQREDSRFLGLRGLLRAAMARGDWDSALSLAREAEAAQPGAAWLREERAQLALRTRDWREALALAPPETPRAALALAAAEQEPDSAKAAELERQGFQADPGFAPAALSHARRLREGGSLRRARAVLEEAWARRPHPDLAAPYLADEPDPLMRVKAAESLARHNPGHPESRLLMARTALDAGLTGRARTALEMLLRERGGAGADRRAYLMLAEVEEAEHGETSEARAAQARWLREAAKAPAEPVWRCGNCGAVHEAWKPVCTACDAVGQIAWTTPVAAAVPAPAPAARAATEAA